MIHVIVTATINPGSLDEYLRLAAELAPQVEAEAGCRRYSYTLDIASPIGIQDPVDENRVTLIEEWESLAHLEAHLSAPHMSEYGPRMSGLRSSVAAIWRPSVKATDAGPSQGSIRAA